MPLARAAALGVARPGARVARSRAGAGIERAAVAPPVRRRGRATGRRRWRACCGSSGSWRWRGRGDDLARARVRGRLRRPGAPDARVPAVVGAHAGGAGRLGRGCGRRAARCRAASPANCAGKGGGSPAPRGAQRQRATVRREGRVSRPGVDQVDSRVTARLRAPAGADPSASLTGAVRRAPRPFRSSHPADQRRTTTPMIEKAEEYIWANARVLEQRRFELLFKGGAKAARHRRGQALQDARRRLRVRAGARRARPDEPAAAHLDRAGGTRGRRDDRRRRPGPPHDHDRARRRRPRRPPLTGAVSARTLVAHRHRGQPACHELALRAARQTRRGSRLAGTSGDRSAGPRSTRSRRRTRTTSRPHSHSSTPRATRTAPRRPPSGSASSSRSRTSSARSPRATAEGEIHYPHDFARRPDSLARPWFTDEEMDDSLDQLAAQQQDDGGWRITWPCGCPRSSTNGAGS